MSKEIATAITADATPGQDAQGNYVACLTEAVMGITSALTEIAKALQEIASSIQNLSDIIYAKD